MKKLLSVVFSLVFLVSCAFGGFAQDAKTDATQTGSGHTEKGKDKTKKHKLHKPKKQKKNKEEGADSNLNSEVK